MDIGSTIDFRQPNSGRNKGDKMENEKMVIPEDVQGQQALSPLEMLDRQFEDYKIKLTSAEDDLMNQGIEISELKKAKEEALAAFEKSKLAGKLLFDFLTRYPYISESRNEILKTAMNAYRELTEAT